MAEGTFCFFLACPFVDAVSVVGVVAGAPGDGAAITFDYFIGLALEAGLVDAVFTDGTVFDGYVPTPQSDSIPLFNLYSFIDLHFQIIII